MNLEKWTEGMLRNALYYQDVLRRDPDIQCGMGPCRICGKAARGSGVCAECIKKELKRRGKNE